MRFLFPGLENPRSDPYRLIYLEKDLVTLRSFKDLVLKMIFLTGVITSDKFIVTNF
jgi:hypothetical protein